MNFLGLLGVCDLLDMIQLAVVIKDQDFALGFIIPAVEFPRGWLPALFQHLLFQQRMYLVTGDKQIAAAHLLGQRRYC